MYEIGNKSLFFLTVVMGFIGMILVLQAGIQTKRVIPELSLLGANYLELLDPRPRRRRSASLMLATRVGAGIAAEIGSMVVTEQVDALRMCAADPIDYLIKPRFLASIVMTTVLGIWAAGVAIATGMLTAYVMFDLRPATFFNLSLVNAGDVTLGLAKCLAYGAAIPVVARALRALDVRRIGGRGVGDDARGGQLVARGHRARHADLGARGSSSSPRGEVDDDHAIPPSSSSSSPGS